MKMIDNFKLYIYITKKKSSNSFFIQIYFRDFHTSKQISENNSYNFLRSSVNFRDLGTEILNLHVLEDFD